MSQIPFVRIQLDGNPIYKMRHRSTRTGKIYDAQKQQVRRTMFEIHQQFKGEKLVGPLRVDFLFRMAPPLSWSKAKRERACRNMIRPAVKPDVSNLVKYYEDCMNGIIYRDDAQIVALEATKQYASEPSTVIMVKELWL